MVIDLFVIVRCFGYHGGLEHHEHPRPEKERYEKYEVKN